MASYTKDEALQIAYQMHMNGQLDGMVDPQSGYTVADGLQAPIWVGGFGGDREKIWNEKMKGAISASLKDGASYSTEDLENLLKANKVTTVGASQINEAANSLGIQGQEVAVAKDKPSATTVDAAPKPDNTPTEPAIPQYPYHENRTQYKLPGVEGFVTAGRETLMTDPPQYVYYDNKGQKHTSPISPQELEAMERSFSAPSYPSGPAATTPELSEKRESFLDRVVALIRELVDEYLPGQKNNPPATASASNAPSAAPRETQAPRDIASLSPEQIAEAVAQLRQDNSRGKLIEFGGAFQDGTSVSARAAGSQQSFAGRDPFS